MQYLSGSILNAATISHGCPNRRASNDSQHTYDSNRGYEHVNHQNPKFRDRRALGGGSYKALCRKGLRDTDSLEKNSTGSNEMAIRRRWQRESRGRELDLLF